MLLAPQEHKHTSCVMKDGAGATVLLLTASEGCLYFRFYLWDNVGDLWS